MSEQDLKDVFAKAAEIAAAVPKELQQSAFTRALDHLLGKRTPNGAGKTPGHAPGSETTANAENNLDQIDRTSHPEVTNAPRVLERSLMILRIARDELGVDGLHAPDIARVLTEKFRVRATRQAVTQALDAAADKVDRVRAGNHIKYRIMRAGEIYLDAGNFTARQASTRTRARSMAKSHVPKAEKEKTGPTSKTKRTSSPKISVDELLTAGYFSSPRRIADIREHLRHKKGRIFTLPELSPVLLRLVRSQRLDREKAADGQYEYKVK